MMPKTKHWLWPLAAAFLALGALPAQADWSLLNMPEGITEISRQTYGLHMTIIWICVIISLGVFGVLLWSIVRHRKSRGHQPAQFHENTTVEIIWTLVPFLILVGMAVPSTRVLSEIYDPSDAELDIMITGYQWRWQYRYLS